MQSKTKRFLAAIMPMIGTQILLLTINLLTSSSFMWSFIPIAAIGIGQLSAFSHIFLREDNKAAGSLPEGELSREDVRQAARDFKRQSKDIARDIKNGVLTPEEAQAMLVQASAAVAAPGAEANAAGDSYIAQAKRYQAQLQGLMKANPGNSVRQADLLQQIDTWVKSVESMSARVRDFERNPVVQQDLKAVPDMIRALEAKLERETDARMRDQLERTLTTRRNQLSVLEKLAATIRQSEVQLESTVASLGTMYSQMLTAQTTNQSADYSHLAADVSEQVNQLQDQIEAIEEVKLGQVK